MRSRKCNNILGLFGLFITAVIGLLAYYNESMIGFPDGGRTEYDRFYEATLYPIFFSLNALFSLAFITSIYRKKKSSLTFILYVTLLIVFQITQYYFSINLENGQGG